MPLYKLTHAQYCGLLTFFKNHSIGEVLGRNEIRAILGKNGIDADDGEIQALIDSVSVDSRGITWQAFVDAASNYQEMRDVDFEYREAFRIWDADGNGRLSKDEVGYILKKMGCKDVNMDELFERVDKDKNGTIEYNEFVELMSRVC